MPKKNRKRRHPLVRWAQANSITMERMAKQLGVSRTAIHYWDTGARVPRAFVMQMIVDYTKGAVTPYACYRHWLAIQRTAHA